MDTDPDNWGTVWPHQLTSLQSLFSPLHVLSLSSRSVWGRVAVPILQMKKLVSTEGWFHRESMAQLGLFLPHVPPQGHVCVGHFPSLAVFSVLTAPPWGRDRMGPYLLLWGCQGTAREVTHPRSLRGTRLGGWRNQGYRGTWPTPHPLPQPGCSCLNSESG